MPKPKGLTRKDLERIVREQAPGYKIAPEQHPPNATNGPAQRRSKPDVTVPSMEQMRRKYDRGPGTDATRAPMPKARPGQPRSRVVPLEPESPSSDARRVAPKRIVVSGKGKITSRQG